MPPVRSSSHCLLEWEDWWHTLAIIHLITIFWGGSSMLLFRVSWGKSFYWAIQCLSVNTINDKDTIILLMGLRWGMFWNLMMNLKRRSKAAEVFFWSVLCMIWCLLHIFIFRLPCRDTLIVSLGNCFTSIMAGFPIFSILGFMAKQLGKTVPEVVTSGMNNPPPPLITTGL